MDETIKYLQETGITKEDIQNLYKEIAELKEAIITAQHRINDNKNEEFYNISDLETMKDIASDAKMEIFKLWHIAYTGRKYGE